MIKFDKDFDTWQNEYHTIERVDLKEYLNEDNFNTLKKLDIKYLNKKYTGYEFECLKLELAQYYKDENEEIDEDDEIKSLSEKNVSDIEYKHLLEIIEHIDENVVM